MLPALALASVVGLVSVVTMGGPRASGTAGPAPAAPDDVAPASGVRLIREVAST